MATKTASRKKPAPKRTKDRSPTKLTFADGKSEMHRLDEATTATVDKAKKKMGGDDIPRVRVINRLLAAGYTALFGKK
jgi:hypothetical protein